MPVKFLLKKKGPTPPKPNSAKTLKRKELEALGKRWVDFVIDTNTWESFKASVCGEEKPSVILIRMIEIAIGDKS